MPVLLSLSPEPADTPDVEEAGRKGVWAGRVGSLEEASRLDRTQSS